MSYAMMWLSRQLYGLACGVALALACAGVVHAEEKAPIAVRFTLDRPIDAMAAPFTLAQAGLFRSAGLAVKVDVAAGATDAITRIASGASDLALADLNELIRYRDRTDAAPVKAIFIVQDRAPYAIVARKSRGVVTLADLNGKSILVVDNDPVIQLWPALQKHNNIATFKMKRDKVSPAVREPMLSAGQVDAITALSYVSPVNLRDRGIPADDLDVFKFSELGSQAYGTAIIVNPVFAEQNGDAVRAFLRAAAQGIETTLREPTKAIDSVMAAMPSGSRELETRRLTTIIKDQLLLDAPKDMIGGITAMRFDASLAEIAESFTFRKQLALSDIFDSAFLPATPGRTTN